MAASSEPQMRSRRIPPSPTCYKSRLIGFSLQLIGMRLLELLKCLPQLVKVRVQLVVHRQRRWGCCDNQWTEELPGRAPTQLLLPAGYSPMPEVFVAGSAFTT